MLDAQLGFHSQIGFSTWHFWFLEILFPQFSKQPRCVRLGVGGCVSTSLGFCLSLPRWCPSSVGIFICPKLSAYSSPFFCCLRARSVDFGSHAFVSTTLSLLVSSLLPKPLVTFVSCLCYIWQSCDVLCWLMLLLNTVFLQSSGCECIGFNVGPSCETVGEETCAQNSRPGRALLKTALDCPDSPSS